MQAIRKEAQEEVQAARKKAREEARKEVQETQERGIEKLLSAFKSLSISKDMARQRLMKEYELSGAEADKKLELYGY